MKLKKGFLSLLIATILTSLALIVPSINVYAATNSKTLLKSSITTSNIQKKLLKSSATTSNIQKNSLKSSATTSNIQIIKEVGLVHDIVHNVYIYAGLANVTGTSKTYTVGIVITLDTNGNILTYGLAPNMDQFQSIVTDEKGDVVIGSCYNEYTSVAGANAQPIPEYMATYNYVYTTSDGGKTFSQTASGDRMVDFTTGMYYTGYDGTMYLGRSQSITYSGNQFIATGEYGAIYYSANGYNWHQ